jgi:hypothetical protein
MKLKTSIEFGISAVKLSDSCITVEGRCHKGPISLHDTFTAASEMTVETSSESCKARDLLPTAAVKLRVDVISAYRHQLQELSQSMTASLQLSGSGIEHIKVGMVLSNHQ